MEDELLREDIAWAVDARSKRRLKNALRIAERLRDLDPRRQERAAEALEVKPRPHSRSLLRSLVTTSVTLLAGVAGALPTWLEEQFAER